MIPEPTPTMHDDARAANDAPDAETLEAFLAAVQPRAVVMARLALGDEDDALDAVQDAMVAFVRRYGERPADERRPLFHRILDNRITDVHRTRTRRGRWWWRPRRRDEAPDPVEQATADPAVLPGPDGQAEHDQFSRRLQRALTALPDRQRQVFLLRAWEQLDVRETAAALEISPGSVKTHYFRAQARLRELMEQPE